MSDASTVKVAIVGPPATPAKNSSIDSCIIRRPNCCVTSRQYVGQTLADFPRFAGQGVADTLQFTEPDPCSAAVAEIVFLALPHGVAAEYAEALLNAGAKVIDLSADFRLNDPAVYEEFYGKSHPAPALLTEAVYGMPELHRDTIRSARLIAAPGCYPTSILLPTAPLLKAGLIKSTGIIANSLSGVSGAGRKADVPFLYAECNESVRPYGIPKHRHLSEIEQELSLAAGEQVTIQFSPHLIPVTRAFSPRNIWRPRKFQNGRGRRVLSPASQCCLAEAYDQEPFVRLLPDGVLPDTKYVTQSNCSDLAWRLDRRTGRLIITSAIDNLVKGASGQAVQALNLLCGFDETAGLQ